MHKIRLPRLLQPMRCHDLVRIGANNDGGYLVNQQDIARSKMLLSFGIGQDWTFEQQFCQQAQCAVKAFDPDVETDSPERQEFFQQPHSLQLLGVSKMSDGQHITVSQALSGHRDVFLKCDIEGGEYDIFQDILNCADTWTGMVLEVHDIDKWDNYDQVTNFISKSGLRIVHLHVNNWGYWMVDDQPVPRYMEISLSSGSNLLYDPTLTLPHDLDMPNNAGDQEFSMTF